MIEFLQTYGLWIALAGIFIIMNRFGMGCCGGGHQHEAPPRNNALPEGPQKDGKLSGSSAQKPAGGCH